jgi:Rrf2 family protein
MSYSLSFTHAILAMIYVADKVQQGMYDFVPIQQISHDLNIPVSSTAAIFRSLSRAGLIETREGAKGGVRLALPAEQVTILDILRAIEQERPLFQTHLQPRVTGDKPTKAQHTIAQILSEAEQTMKQRLATSTINDVLKVLNA